MTAPGTCPSRDTLAALLLGTLPPDHEEAVSRHLEACASCEVWAQELEGATDPLIDALRGTDPPPTAPAPAAEPPTRWIGGSALDTEPEPARLAGYRIVREVGRGGMGVVYEAVQHKLGRPVAIKMILAGRLAGPEDRVRFLLEGELLARLNHPNFVHVYEVGTVAVAAGVEQPYLVLEYVDGGSLRAELAGRPLPARDAARRALVLARAVAAAHAQGIVHRDLKPANVLIARDGTLKIGDFGLAKEVGAGGSLTPTGLTVGTPDYMAPEQARGDRAVGPAVDVYALGAILYEMLTGRPPFTGEAPVEVILRVLEQAPARPSHLRPGLPRDLQTVCLKCLEKDPAARYARAADLADDLERWLDGRPIRARPAGRVERVVKWARRHPLPAALLALVVLSLALGSAASTHFGVTATRRAAEAQAALAKEAEARRAADRRSAELQLASGQGLAAAGEVDRGLFVMLGALGQVPDGDDDLRRVIRLNLEAWLPYLPRLRWYTADWAHQPWWPDDDIVLRRDNTVFAVDPATGRASGPPRDFPGFVDLDAAGRLVCTRADRDGVPTFRVFDRRTGRPVGEPVVDRDAAELLAWFDDPFYTVAFTDQPGVLCRVARGDGLCYRRLWDAATGRGVPAQRVAGPEVVRPQTWPAHLLRDRDGRCFWLFVEPGGRTELVDAQTGESRRDARPPADLALPPTLFPDRTVLQSFADGGDVVGLWDLTRGRPVQLPWHLSYTMVGHRMTADGRRLVALSADQRVGWLDLARQQARLPTAGAAREGNAYADWVAPSPDGPSCLYLSAYRVTLKRFDFPRLLPAAADGSDQTRLTTTAPPRMSFGRAAFSPDGRVALLGGTAANYGGPYARLVAAADNRPVGLPLTDCDSFGTFSPSGRLVGLATPDRPTPAAGGLIARAYDAATGRPHGPAFKIPRYIHSLAFSPDERLLAVGHVAGVSLCDLESGGEPVWLKQPGPVTEVLFSRDGRRLAVCSRAGWTGTVPGVAVWDVDPLRGYPAGTRAGELVPMNDAPIVLPAGDGDGFLTVERDRGRVRRWDFAAAAPVEDLGPLPDWPTGSRDRERWATDPARRWLALGSSHGTVHRWDVRTGRRLGPAAEFGRPILLMAFGPDGRWLAVAGENGEVGLFDPLTGKRAGPLLTTGEPIRALAFSPDGGHLLTAAVDGRVTRWDLGGPQPLTADQWQTWLEAATGMRLDGDRLAPLKHAEYDARVAAAAALSTPLALAPTPPARWHAQEALDAVAAGQLNSARWHLDRWVALEPAAWLPLARRAEVSALEGAAAAARADLERAARLCPDSGLADWRRHRAVTGRLTGRPLPALDAP